MTFDIKKALVREINIGTKDRHIRFAAGAATCLLSVFTGNIFLLLLGGILLATAFMRWCPVYSGLSKSTVETQAESGSTASAD
jgi:hypothetical protein